MAAHPILVDRVRGILAGEGEAFEEKAMFGGIAFMVRGKLCVAVGRERLMCRIDPAIHSAALQREGCRTVVTKGRSYVGYVHVDANALESERELKYWLNLSLEYNRTAPASKRKKSR
ncbi:MAG: TfoX/Sxy family protein [Acidobacteria bacterium]|nr:TfoX/Sxy family protein [Acidobacteriota bacterium]